MIVLAHSAPVQHLAFTALCLIATWIYARRWSADVRRSTSALAGWAIGIVGLLAATSPTVEDWAQRSFSGHMVQHLVLVAVVAPGLVIALDPMLRRRGIRRRAARHVADGPWTAPAAALAFVGVLLVTHLTSIYDAALRSQLVHEGEHALYLGTAALVWAALRLGATRRDTAAPLGRIAAIFGVIAGMAILGMVLATAEEPLVSTYSSRQGADQALDDQRIAAALMWVGGMLTSLPLLVLAFWRWAAHEEAAAERKERLADAATSGPGRGRRPPVTRDIADGQPANS